MSDESLARDFVDALSVADVDALRTLVAADARFWINIGPIEMPVEERFAVLEAERSHLDTLRFDDVRVQSTHSGFIVQLTTNATTLAGDALRVPVCLVVATDGARITRVDEYADSAPAAPLLELLHRKAASR